MCKGVFSSQSVLFGKQLWIICSISIQSATINYKCRDRVIVTLVVVKWFKFNRTLQKIVVSSNDQEFINY